MELDKSNVIVSGSRSSLSEYANYTTVYPKPAMVGGKIVLTQEMVSKPNVKYIIKWNFDLNGATVTIPASCLIEFDGGSISNGTLVGNNTILIYSQSIANVLNVALSGTWKHSSDIADEIGSDDKPDSVMGRVKKLEDEVGTDESEGTIKGRVKNIEEEIGDGTTRESLTGRISNLEEAVGDGGSVDERIAEEGAKHYIKKETYNKTELNNLITTPNQQYASFIATNQTTAVTDVLPATGAADTVYRVGNWDGSQFDASVYSEYAWNGSSYVHLSTKTQVGEVFDISAYHATGGELAKYADLAAALNSNNGANIPQSLQKGGMSVKFVRTSDNKYVRYNLLADSFTTDVTQWAIDDAGVYVENLEFAYVKTDREGKILFGVRNNGDFVFGCGVPRQVANYVTTKISVIKKGTASTDIDGINKIIAFLSDFSTSDTLKALLDGKVNNEIGKSLIQTDVAENVEFVENPDFMDVKTDFNGRVIEAVTVDGKKKINVPIEMRSSVVDATNSHEWLYLYLDKVNRTIEGLRTDGTKVVDKLQANELILSLEGREKLKNVLGIENISPDSILALHPKEKTLPILRNMRFWDIQMNDVHPTYTPLSLLWFSDIHADAVNLKRISDFYQYYRVNIDDVLSTGDNVRGFFTDDYTWWDNNGGHKFLTVLGNHEVCPKNVPGLLGYSQKQCYEKYYANCIADWGAIYQTNHTYWYKDYPNAFSEECPNGIRLIALDPYHWKEGRYDTQYVDSGTEYPDGEPFDNGEQETWFNQVLADARQNGLAVIVTLHCTTQDVVDVECTFQTLEKVGIIYKESIKTDMLDAVQDFIDAGGEFIAWLCGHLHQGWFGIVPDYPDQLLIANATASHLVPWRCDDMVEGTMSQDRFNIFNVEPKYKYVRIYRVGLEFDRNLRHIGSICYDYKNKNLIYNY